MAKETLTASSAFENWTSLECAGFEAYPRESLTMASIAPLNGGKADLAARVKAVYGAELPPHPARVSGRDIAFVWMGPDHWLAVAERGANGRDLEVELKSSLGDAAHVVDQSDGRVVVRVAGEKGARCPRKGPADRSAPARLQARICRDHPCEPHRRPHLAARRAATGIRACHVPQLCRELPALARGCCEGVRRQALNRDREFMPVTLAELAFGFDRDAVRARRQACRQIRSPEM